MKNNLPLAVLLTIVAVGAPLYVYLTVYQDPPQTLSPFLSDAAPPPTCQSASSDPDGDGWGWENNKSCKVQKVTTTNNTSGGQDPNCPDPDGDGWGWDGSASCIPFGGQQDTNNNTNNTVNPKVKVQSGSGVAVTPDPSNQFSKFQAANLLFTTNVYAGQNSGDFTKWTVPHNGSSGCSASSITGPITLEFLNTKDIYDNRYVRSFPAMVLGTMGGRYETLGWECGVRNYISSNTLDNASSRRVGTDSMSGILDMQPTSNQTGFPTKVWDLNSTLISVKADIHSTPNNLSNVFLDTYWHDVGEYFGRVSAVADKSLASTINGINENKTELWNLNIWFDYPRKNNGKSADVDITQGWTGARKIGNTTISGHNFDVQFKLEGRQGCQVRTAENCFLYIALVTTNPNLAKNGVTIDYRDVADWFTSDAFRTMFKSSDFAVNTMESMGVNPNDAQVYPSDSHVIGGLHLGSEVWYNENRQPITNTFETLGVRIQGKGDFGLFRQH